MGAAANHQWADRIPASQLMSLGQVACSRSSESGQPVPSMSFQKRCVETSRLELSDGWMDGGWKMKTAAENPGPSPSAPAAMIYRWS